MIPKIPSFKTLLWLSGSLLLHACTLTETPNSNTQWRAQQNHAEFDAAGRIAVKTQDRGQTAHFEWTRQNGVETFNINTPLGNTVGQLCQDAEGVLAVDNNGKQYHAETAEALSEQLIGYALPVQHLSVWANGEWVSNATHSINSDGTLQQHGWKIARETDNTGKVRLLMLENSNLTLRMLFTQYSDHLEPSNTQRCQAR